MKLLQLVLRGSWTCEPRFITIIRSNSLSLKSGLEMKLWTVDFLNGSCLKFKVKWPREAEKKKP